MTDENRCQFYNYESVQGHHKRWKRLESFSGIPVILLQGDGLEIITTIGKAIMEAKCHGDGRGRDTGFAYKPQQVQHSTSE